MELESTLLRRHLEEQIISIVPLEESWLEEAHVNLEMVVYLKNAFTRKVGLVLILSFIFVDLKHCAASPTNNLLLAFKIAFWPPMALVI